MEQIGCLRSNCLIGWSVWSSSGCLRSGCLIWVQPEELQWVDWSVERALERFMQLCCAFEVTEIVTAAEEQVGLKAWPMTAKYI